MVLSEATTLSLGKGKQIVLNPNPFTTGGNFLAKGGEANVYRNGNQVIKLYYEPKDESKPKYIPKDKLEKLTLLSYFNSPYIISPKGFVYYKDGDINPIGFWMYYGEGEPLARLFTTSGRNRLGFTDHDACILAERMRQVVELAHAYRCMIVDHNDLNWVVYLGGTDGPEPRIMDVDSWMTRQWKAKVVHPLYEDYSANGVFNQNSDWFTWAVVTFQLFTGIHPYKGNLRGYQSNEVIQRMKNNASIFSRGIELPKTVRSFSSIPPSLLAWYKDVFVNGHRGPPPPVEQLFVPSVEIKQEEVIDPGKILWKGIKRIFVVEVPDEELPLPKKNRKTFGQKFKRLFVVSDDEEVKVAEPIQVSILSTAPTVETEKVNISPAPPESLIDGLLDPNDMDKIISAQLDYQCLYHHKTESAQKVFQCGLVLTNGGKLFCLENKQFLEGDYSSDCEVVRTESGWLIADKKTSVYVFKFIDQSNFQLKEVESSMIFEQISISYNMLFGISSTGIAGDLVFDVTKFAVSLSENQTTFDVKSTTWFGDTAVHYAPKTIYLIFKHSSSFKKLKVNELAGLKVINAVSGKEYIAIGVSDSEGRVAKVEFSFLSDGSYAVWREYRELNLTILPKGNVVSFEKDGILESYVPHSGAVRLISDKNITQFTPLYSWGNTVCCIFAGKVYSVKTRGT